MAKQIVVALKRDDRVEQILPSLEKIAEPGTRVVFLIPYPVDGVMWVRDHWVTAESPRHALLAARIIAEKYSWETQRQRAEDKVFPACAALRRRGVEIAVDLYTGSARKVMASYTRNGGVHATTVQAGRGLSLRRFLHGIALLFGSCEQSASAPVLLRRPDHVAVMGINL